MRCVAGLLMQKEMELTNLRAKVAELMSFMPSVTLAGFGGRAGGAGVAVSGPGAGAMRYSPTAYTGPGVQQDGSPGIVGSPNDFTSSMSQ